MRILGGDYEPNKHKFRILGKQSLVLNSFLPIHIFTPDYQTKNGLSALVLLKYFLMYYYYSKNKSLKINSFVLHYRLISKLIQRENLIVN